MIADDFRKHFISILNTCYPTILYYTGLYQWSNIYATLPLTATIYLRLKFISIMNTSHLWTGVELRIEINLRTKYTSGKPQWLLYRVFHLKRLRK